MSQTWESNSFEGTAVAQTDLQNMENNFATLKSCFSGTSAPSNPVDGQIYRNTTYDNWRGYTGAAWVGILQGSANFKLWVYMNAAEIGWIVDTTPSDTVLAVKGGSTYTTGGAAAGSWTISGVSVDSHTLTTSEIPGHSHSISVSAYVSSGGSSSGVVRTATGSIPLSVGGFSSSGGGSGGGHAHTMTMTGAWRPSASVGTIQFVDLS